MATRHDDEGARREVDRLLAPLRETPAPEWTPARAVRVREAIEARRRRSAPWLAWVVATTAAAAAAWALWPVAPTPTAAPAPEPVAVATAPAPIAAGERLTAARTLPSGAQIQIEGGAVRVAEATPAGTRLVLERGAVTSRVPRLGPGEHYVVETPHALVSVHGTRFTVELLPAGATKVVVTEGVVEVAPRDGRPAEKVRAGGTLVVGPATAAASADDARAAEARGDWAEAVRLWRAVAERSGDGLERQNALVAAGRLLSQHDVAAAVEHWRAFAAEARGGVHHEEAAWRAADALRRAGRTAEAAEAERRFRQAFPHSAYAP
jgi:ferric-dicitrate binding protein FerR (iron transport regulator)